MTNVGMDVTAMRAVADELDQAARSLDALVARVDGDARTATSGWFGPVAAEFAQAWHGRSKTALLALCGEVAGLSVTLRHEISQQDVASSAAPVMASLGSSGADAAMLRVGKSHEFAHGHLLITEKSAFDGRSPENIRDLVAGLRYHDSKDQGRRAYDYPGGIAVAFTGQPPERHAIVTVSGTTNWSIGTTDINDLQTNAENMFGLHSAKEDAIREAMLQAGVTPRDQVMLVGHSQGGADALDFAHDHGNDSQFDIRSVVTVGAPQTTKYPPASVDVLQLRGTADVVPHLGLRTVEDGLTRDDPALFVAERMLNRTPSNVHVVDVGETWNGGVFNSHNPNTYMKDLDLNDPRITSFESRQAGFFGTGPTSSVVFSDERVTAQSPRTDVAYPPPVQIPRLPWETP